MNKLKSRKGETITEVLVSLLIAVISIALLMSSVTAASKINAKVRKNLTEEIYFKYSTAAAQEDGTTVTIGFGIATENIDVSVQTYEDNGYRFYSKK